MTVYATFAEACRRLDDEFKFRSQTVRSERWQGVETKPEHVMREVLFPYIQVPLRGLESLEHWQKDIEPNLPFADVHFAERVGGEPTNPGEAWKIWPWGNAADAHRTEGGKFTHTYQERFWPKYAQASSDGSLRDETLFDIPHLRKPSTLADFKPMSGIRYEYGDLNDLVGHLAKEPFSRQAYLPIWFPEDGTCSGRKPCTLGYHFIHRFEYLHVSYYIRSCDYVRHFRDDCYLTIRLLLWILDRLRERDERWHDVRPGMFNMHIGSLHMFTNDWIQRYPDQAKYTQREPVHAQ